MDGFINGQYAIGAGLLGSPIGAQQQQPQLHLINGQLYISQPAATSTQLFQVSEDRGFRGGPFFSSSSSSPYETDASVSPHQQTLLPLRLYPSRAVF